MQIPPKPTVEEAQTVLSALAELFLATSAGPHSRPRSLLSHEKLREDEGPDYEARYKALVEHIPAVIFVAPLESGWGDAYVSPQIETILGFTPEEWLGDPLRWYERVHPEDKPRWSAEAASLFLSGEPLSSNYRVIARDGRVVWFQCDARMVHSGNGKPSFIHGIGFDVTELKETESSLRRAQNELEARAHALALTNAQLNEEIAEHKRTELLLITAKETAEAAMRVKGEFMANMSHEIRTPLNGVLGLTRLVLDTQLTADQQECLSIAHSSAESLLSIINQVLDFSRVESHKSELYSAEFSLRRGVEGLVDELRHHAKEKGLDLACLISPDVPDRLQGDLGHLKHVLTNLIGNAIKFTQAGRVDLKIEFDRPVEQIETRECVLRFTVVDTGIGVHSSKLKAIFEPFVQGDGSIAREFGGTGLGLAISKELVAMMGGQIGVASEPGLGSSFYFTAGFGITLNDQEVRSIEPLVSRGRTSALLERCKTAPLQILVVEDNPVNQKVVTRVMQNYGHTVTLATNGHEALEAYGRSLFDVILMDVQMPLMDGLSATKAIRSIERRQGDSHVPVIGLTAHALEADRALCMQAGMDGFLSKPFKANELMSLIEKLTVPLPP